MKVLMRQFADFFASLRLTIALLMLGIVLIFWATLCQSDLGVWGVQQKFFYSLFVVERLPDSGFPLPVFPGGYLIGGFLFVNLIAAHCRRFRLSWRKSGIWLTHLGLILLLVGGFLTSLWQKEYQLRLDEGGTRNYSESDRDCELAVIDETDPLTDRVVAIPEEMLAGGRPVQHPTLPFRVVPKAYFPNASLQMRRDVPNAPPSPATSGMGPQVVATPLPVTYKEDERNLPAAFIELVGPDGSLGTWLVSTELGMPQRFDYAGRSWRISLRFQRRYLPFSVTLLKFSHDIYPGTDIPRNFSSRVRLSVPGQAGREALIYMNNPLRAAGLTFYQASFANDDHTSILQVVRNPGWRLPYASCAIITLGLLVQFGIHLTAFFRKRSEGEARGLA
jgi:uncharacterized membrane protein